MARINAVELLVLTGSGSTAELDTYIATASLLVDEVLLGAGYTEARLKQIELYLSAHFAVLGLDGGQIKSEKLGDASVTIAGKFETGLSLTRFGQQAMFMDTVGVLRKLDASKGVAEFRVV